MAGLDRPFTSKNESRWNLRVQDCDVTSHELTFNTAILQYGCNVNQHSIWTGPTANVCSDSFTEWYAKPLWAPTLICLLLCAIFASVKWYFDIIIIQIRWIPIKNSILFVVSCGKSRAGAREARQRACDIRFEICCTVPWNVADRGAVLRKGSRGKPGWVWIHVSLLSGPWSIPRSSLRRSPNQRLVLRPYWSRPRRSKSPDPSFSNNQHRFKILIRRLKTLICVYKSLQQSSSIFCQPMRMYQHWSPPGEHSWKLAIYLVSVL
jgi:hypothetical protein